MYRISSVNIKNNYVERGCVGSINELWEHHVNISTSVKLCLLNIWRNLNATIVTLLAWLYNVLRFQRVIACYNVIRMLHETGPRVVSATRSKWNTQWLNMFHYSYIPWGRHSVGSFNGLFRALGCPCMCPAMVIASNDPTTCCMSWSCWCVKLFLMAVCVFVPV